MLVPVYVGVQQSLHLTQLTARAFDQMCNGLWARRLRCRDCRATFAVRDNTISPIPVNRRWRFLTISGSKVLLESRVKRTDPNRLWVAEWVHLFNHRRLSEYCGDIPPVELETAYYAQHRSAAAG
jgi:hypothetical protein